MDSRGRAALLRSGVVLIVSVSLLSACGRQAQRDAMRRATGELQKALAGRAPVFVTAHHDGPRLWKLIRAFYAERRYQPAWIEGTKPQPQVDALLRALDNAGQHGLDPELYDLGPLSQARSQARTRLLGTSGFEPQMVAPLDLRLTAAWLEYASDLANGVTARPHADPMWKVKPRSIDLLPILKSALSENRAGEALDGLAPNNDEYRRLPNPAGLAHLEAGSAKPARVAARETPRDHRRPAVECRIARPDLRRTLAAGGEALRGAAWAARQPGAHTIHRGRDECPRGDAHPPDRVEHGTVAMVSARPWRRAHPRERARVSPGPLGSRTDRARDERRRRRGGQADADLQRHDDHRRVRPLLERAGEHRQRRDATRGRERPGLSGPQQYRSRLDERRGN